MLIYYSKIRSLAFNQASLTRMLSNPNAYGQGPGDQFGQAAAISGNYAIIGTHLEDDVGGTESGKAYIFDVTTGSLLNTLNNPNPVGASTYDYFGCSVSISGNYAVVGAYSENSANPVGDSSGVVYVFNVVTGQLVATILNPGQLDDSPNDRFGFCVDLDGKRVSVGAPTQNGVSGAIYVYELS